MVPIQLLTSTPEWARQKGLNDKSFNILEQVVLNPEQQETILSKLEEGVRCCILQALSFARDKGLL